MFQHTRSTLSSDLRIILVASMPLHWRYEAKQYCNLFFKESCSSICFISRVSQMKFHWWIIASSSVLQGCFKEHFMDVLRGLKSYFKDVSIMLQKYVNPVFMRFCLMDKIAQNGLKCFNMVQNVSTRFTIIQNFTKWLIRVRLYGSGTFLGGEHCLW